MAQPNCCHHHTCSTLGPHTCTRLILEANCGSILHDFVNLLGIATHGTNSIEMLTDDTEVTFMAQPTCLDRNPQAHDTAGYNVHV